LTKGDKSLKNDQLNRLYTEAIIEARKTKPDGKRIIPRVGAVLADESGEVFLKAHRGMTDPRRHCEYELLNQIEKDKINVDNAVLFVTLEPCTVRGEDKTPCANRIIDSGIKKVYIGMLDPNPLICGKGERFLRRNNIAVERFPDKFVRELENINKEFIAQYEDQTLDPESWFIKKNIRELVKDSLERNSLKISFMPAGDNTINDVISACIFMNPEINHEIIKNMVVDAVGDAFDTKYLERNMKGDARGYDIKKWVSEFSSLLDKYHVDSCTNLKTVVVGIGNGAEGHHLGYEDIENLIFVDIARKSLERAHTHFPHAEIYHTSAQKMSKIPTASIDLYISLMTYQSSYFNIDKALSEACRVINHSGIIIISIPAGYMKKINGTKIYIPGLVEDMSKKVNRDRPHEIIQHIRKKLEGLSFTSININTTLSEIYIVARKTPLSK